MDEQARLTVDAVDAADLLGVSERTFHTLRKRPGFPRPIALLGPRRPRWRTVDLYHWINAVPTIDVDAPEPGRLARSRATPKW
jgi:predicted DNA-binding transcriptional regulator AlpA